MTTAKDVRDALARGEGPLAKAADDEPVFVLRAQDRLAPDLIDHLGHLMHANGSPDDKVASAVMIADSMRAWQRANGSKVPD